MNFRLPNPDSPEYRDNYDRVFGKREPTAVCPLCMRRCIKLDPVERFGLTIYGCECVGNRVIMFSSQNARVVSPSYLTNPDTTPKSD